MIQEKIKSLIKEGVSALKWPSNLVDAIELEHPKEITNGDYSFAVIKFVQTRLGSQRRLEKAYPNASVLINATPDDTPIVFANKLKIILEELVRKNSITEINKIQVASPGFINFFLSKEFFTNSISDILDKKEDFGRSTQGNGKKVIVEYSSPNIAKPFTVGHLRSTIIGQSISNILSFSGYEVLKDNHLGDWGTQFGKMIVAIKKFGNESEIENSDRPVKNLVELYVKFHDEAEKNKELEDEARAWFTKLEQGDAEARRLWQKCVDWSMVEFEKIYKRLGVSFDMMLGESFFEDKMKSVLEDLEKTDFYKESENAKLVFFPDEKYPPLMIQKKDGSTLYATRDLATDKYRKDKWNPDLVINEVGKEQSLYFQQLFETEEMLGYFKKEQRVHVAHGLYRFKEGKMSTRKGNVIWLEDILDEGILRASKINPETAEVVGMGAIKFNDLKSESSKDIVFNWDEILNLEGDSGPYIQYSYVRTQAVLRKAKEMNIISSVQNFAEDIFTLEKLLYRFPEVVSLSAKQYSPHTIAQYILNVAHEFSSFYGNNQILNNEDVSSSYKLALVEATSYVLKNGLNLLGIESPEKM